MQQAISSCTSRDGCCRKKSSARWTASGMYCVYMPSSSWPIACSVWVSVFSRRISSSCPRSSLIGRHPAGLTPALMSASSRSLTSSAGMLSADGFFQTVPFDVLPGPPVPARSGGGGGGANPEAGGGGGTDATCSEEDAIANV
uniref:Uncharacterized protein n=1 Tax=Anopheles merus TaxID=30066 RepID=A0A182USL4_ANOME